jgi:hypothetical protein
MTDEETRTDHNLLTAAYEAFNARDIESVLRLMSPEVDWPNGLDGGHVHGQDAVRDYWLRQFAMFDPHVEPIEITRRGDRVVVDVHQVVRDLTGKVLVDHRIEHIYAIRNGVIERMDVRDPEE